MFQQWDPIYNYFEKIFNLLEFFDYHFIAKKLTTNILYYIENDIAALKSTNYIPSKSEKNS